MKFPLMLFPRIDKEGRCVECGVHLNWCEECQVLWAGTHTCKSDEELCQKDNQL
jgi:hypothetical protein